MLSQTDPQSVDPVVEISEQEQHHLLELSGIERSFEVNGQELKILKGIDLTLERSKLIMLRGRSGSGKTTLLNIMGGLDIPTNGKVLFEGQPIHKWGDDRRTELRRKKLGFIFQTYALLPLLTAWENVELSLRLADVPKEQWDARIKYCLEILGLGKRMYHRPYELSGGEQQRVAIAKSIAHKPELLLADEPTAEVDTQMSAHIISMFKDLIQAENITICMTTHDPTILEVADHVYEMVDGKIKLSS